ncbi:hypothetical protein ATCM_12650 [Stenotrophomonas sp. ATCM1_4]|nr:hypothetical protein ATCM_12650 [Stenotrophomonas sp. ATCM1_4]
MTGAVNLLNKLLGSDDIKTSHKARLRTVLAEITAMQQRASEPATGQEAVAWRLDVNPVTDNAFAQYVTDPNFADTLRDAGIAVEVTPLYAAAPVAAAPVDGDAIERLQDAIEGECEGLGVSKETAAAILAYVYPAVATSPVVAYMVDGRLEQGLTFDKSAAENMAMFNAGTVRPLAFADSTPAAPGIDLGQIWERAHADMLARRRRNKHDCFVLRCLKDCVDALVAEQADASPKGGSDVRESIASVIAELESVHVQNNKYRMGCLGADNIDTAVRLLTALQATSAEVGS